MRRFFTLLLAAVLFCVCLAPSMLGEDTPLPEQNVTEELAEPEADIGTQTEPESGPNEETEPAEEPKEEAEPSEEPVEEIVPAEEPVEEIVPAEEPVKEIESEEDMETAEAPEKEPASPAYTVELPASILLESSPTAFEMKVEILSLGAGERLRITAASQNGFNLVSDAASLPYTLTGLSGEYIESATDELTVTYGDISSLPAGTLTDTLTITFTVLPAE